MKFEVEASLQATFTVEADDEQEARSIVRDGAVVFDMTMIDEFEVNEVDIEDVTEL